MLFESFESFFEILKVSNKTLNLRPFEVFSQVFRLPLRFWIMSEVFYEKNGVLLLSNEIIFTFEGKFDLRSINFKFGPYCWICSGFLH